MALKENLTWHEQAQLLRSRGLVIPDLRKCESALAQYGYYRLSGYFRYFQIDPKNQNNEFHRDFSFDDIIELYLHDMELRQVLLKQLSAVEIMLRSHVAQLIGKNHSPYNSYLQPEFYHPSPQQHHSVSRACLRDIERSKEAHIRHYLASSTGADKFCHLPVWSAVEAWSFGTLSKVIQHGAKGELAAEVAQSLGVARKGLATRTRALVYLRNRCAHHARLWNHVVIDAGGTPNNVRKKAKIMVGAFDPRSVIDVIASLDDIASKGGQIDPVLPKIEALFNTSLTYWAGLLTPSTQSGSAHL